MASTQPFALLCWMLDVEVVISVYLILALFLACTTVRLPQDQITWMPAQYGTGFCRYWRWTACGWCLKVKTGVSPCFVGCWPPSSRRHCHWRLLTSLQTCPCRWFQGSEKLACICLLDIYFLQKTAKSAICNSYILARCWSLCKHVSLHMYTKLLSEVDTTRAH